MQISFTKKMILDEEKFDDKGFQTIIIRSYLRVNYIERMIKLYFREFKPQQIAFSSYSFGNAVWASEKGIIHANTWESENQLIDKSNLTKHFQSSFENSAVPTEFALQNIIPDALSALLEDEFSKKIHDLVFSNIDVSPEEWKLLVDAYKVATNEFLKSLGER